MNDECRRRESNVSSTESTRLFDAIRTNQEHQPQVGALDLSEEKSIYSFEAHRLLYYSSSISGLSLLSNAITDSDMEISDHSEIPMDTLQTLVAEPIYCRVNGDRLCALQRMFS